MSEAIDVEDEFLTPEEALRELLEEIVDAMGLDATIEVTEAGDVLTGSVSGENVGHFIGRHGQTIDAVQHLARRIVFAGERSATRVVIDADGYRARREQALCQQADTAADDAVRTGTRVQLEPMPASERRVVHEHLRLRGDVETFSEGEEPGRYLVVDPLRS